MKRILFISHHNYHNEIISSLEELGYEVAYYNDKPNDGFLCKFAGRYKIKFFERYFNSYYKKIAQEIINIEFDYIFMINAEYMPLKSLQMFRSQHKKSTFILYLWDSIRNKKGTKEKLKFFDYCYSFDTFDVSNNIELTLMPLFYIKDFQFVKKADYQYDIAFIGTAHGDRPKIINYVKAQCNAMNKRMFSYLYSPHLLVFCYNKLFNKDYKGIRYKDIYFKKLAFAKTAEIYQNSRCVIDIENREQSGLTIRTIEMLGLKKKLITTNKEIVKYDFYNPNNILVVDRDNFIVDFDFVNRKYEELPEAIYQSYFLKNRLKQILEKTKSNL